jgi:hypothetical protein
MSEPCLCPHEADIATLKEQHRSSVDAWVRVETKVDNLDKHLRNGISHSITSSHVQLKFLWAFMLIVIASIVGTLFQMGTVRRTLATTEVQKAQELLVAATKVAQELQSQKGTP